MFKVIGGSRPAKQIDLNILLYPFFGISNFVVFNKSRSYCTTFYLNKNFWSKFIAYTNLSVPCKLTHITDGIQFISSSDFLTLQFNINSMICDSKIQLISNIQIRNSQMLTVSSLYSSTVWLERELSDFSNINFTGLSDTRRLLLDYLEHKQFRQTHNLIDKNFNNNYYDVFLSY